MSDLEKMDSVLDGKVNEKPSRYSSTSKAGLEPGWTRTSFILKEELAENLRALAYLNRSSMKAELDRILESYFSANPIDSRRLPERLPERP